MSKIAGSVLFGFIIFAQIAMAEMVYPYFATKERSELILSKYSEIEIGDTEEQVLNKLPNPDEIRKLYEPKIYKAKIIGKTYWYIIQRMVKTGSVTSKDEKMVRVSFNLQGKVIAVDHWGI